MYFKLTEHKYGSNFFGSSEQFLNLASGFKDQEISFEVLFSSNPEVCFPPGQAEEIKAWMRKFPDWRYANAEELAKIASDVFKIYDLGSKLETLAQEVIDELETKQKT